jgi:hypothetical protein
MDYWIIFMEINAFAEVFKNYLFTFIFSLSHLTTETEFKNTETHFINATQIFQAKVNFFLVIIWLIVI